MIEPVDRAVRAVARRNSHARSELRERRTLPITDKQTEVRLWAPKARHQRPSATPAGAHVLAGAVAASD